ncbi:MAG TPA: hypothetical protein PK620_03520 [Denitromonas sp.]|nr:hypothetical protein [Denitromonas sp.]HQU87659.1 hypothetical protein [Denitromonas sp.]HQV13962.1 hypothetical protein [Denitromonas sp.]
MIPLMEKAGDKPFHATADKDNGQWKREGLDLTKAWGFKSGVGLKDHFKQQARYKGVGPLRTMNSDKLKSHWPKFKDRDTTKWSEVYTKDTNGRRRIDRTKMRQYLGEQVQSLKLSSKDFIKLEIEHYGTLGPEALERWNENAHTERAGEVEIMGAEVGDIELSAEAAAMRYFSGGSLEGSLAPLKGNVFIKAEGSAEVAFAEGRASADFYFPAKEGLLLTFYDLAQIDAIMNGESPGEPYSLGPVRFAAAAELSGVLGVSVAGEVSIGVEMVDIETKDVDGKTKPGKMPHIKGSRRKVKRKNRANVTGKGADWTNKAGLDAEVNFFAGARGGLALRGAVQWRNPHSEAKKFEDFAAVAPKLEGMAGIAGEAKLAVEYIDGIFRITAHAGLCFGVGASGEVSLAVGVKQIVSFVFWAYYTLACAGFKSLEFVAKDAFAAWRNVIYLVVCDGQAVERYFAKSARDLDRFLFECENRFTKAEGNIALGKSILAKPESVRYSPPETKGMLLYQLTRFSIANWLKDGTGAHLGDEYLPTQRKAALTVLRQARTKADMDNIIQHIGPMGEKGDFQANLDLLKRFFAAEGPRGLDVPFSRTPYQQEFQDMRRGLGDKDFLAMEGDFGAWYEQTHATLAEEVRRGYPALDNSTLEYAMQMDMARDHPLFASTGRGFYADLT